ncbi:MAG: hypothetical protein EXS32_04550 [Opitutus sp.]|nr:hypothetical protein [Opitutus sp.]
MNILTARIIVIAVGLAGWSASSSAQTAAQAAAHWEGTVHMEKLELGLVIDLARKSSGAWIGSMSFPGTPTVDAPLGDIAVDDKSGCRVERAAHRSPGALLSLLYNHKSVRFTARVPGVATFAGMLSADASSLSGTASNAAGETTIQLKRNGEDKVKLPPPSSPLPKEFTGSWAGTIEADGKTRHVGLKLSPATDGIAVGTLIAIDHGNLEIPITTVTIQDKRLQFESRAISGNFRGTLGDNGEITGEWSEGPKRLPLTFKQAPAEPTKP